MTIAMLTVGCLVFWAVGLFAALGSLASLMAGDKGAATLDLVSALCAYALGSFLRTLRDQAA